MLNLPIIRLSLDSSSSAAAATTETYSFGSTTNAIKSQEGHLHAQNLVFSTAPTSPVASPVLPAAADTSCTVSFSSTHSVMLIQEPKRSNDLIVVIWSWFLLANQQFLSA